MGDFKVIEEETFKLKCGNCAWWFEQPDPKDEKKMSGWGVCYANPPTVLLTPVVRQVALAGQEGQPGILPKSYRPILNGEDSICCMYAPNPEAQKGLSEMDEELCTGSCKDCNCETPKA